MSDDIVQEAIKSLEDWDTCYSQNEEMRDAALAALKVQADEIERLRAENEKLREALEPFAELAFHTGSMSGSDGVCVFVGDLRAAAAAIREKE